MTWHFVVLGLLASIVGSQAFILDTFINANHSIWNDLKVTWGINPFTAYTSQPRTQTEAEADGWVEIVSGASCDSNPHFKGKRFVKNNDTAIILLYDVNGYIAGIQASFPRDYPGNQNHYPTPNITPHPMVLDGNDYVITAYFVDPAIICTTGRSAADFQSQGTGSGLWIQNGTDPVMDSPRIPHLMTDADKTMWTKNKCFKTMGVHYWYNLSPSMSCDTIFPVFLLYNGGVLNGFGWAFGINIKESSVFEHPTPGSYSAFLDPVPTCLGRWGTLTTLHIYMDSHYLLDLC